MPEPTEKPQSLVSKLAEVMAHADRIPKLGKNAAQGYEYARASDVLAEVRKELADRSIFVSHEVTVLDWRTLETKNGKVQIATVHMTLTAHDGETGQSLAFAKTIGEGMDYGDKQSGKALTGAMKYGILNGFMIPTGDDPENDAVPTPRQKSSSGRPSNEGTSARAGETPVAPSSGPTIFPNFGRMKGQPLAGAPVTELEYYLVAARKTLTDPSKAKFHAKESALIGAIEAELARQRGSAQPPPDGQRQTKPAPTKPPAIVDQQPDESEEHAKMRQAGAFYAKAVKAGQNAGWEQADVGKWLRENRKRGGKSEVTAADAEAFCQHLEPPPEPGAAG